MVDQPSDARPSSPDPSRARPGRRGRRRLRRAGQVLLVAVSVLVLAVTGYAWGTLRMAQNGMTTEDVIDANGGGEHPADGSVDILVIGLDSRTDVQGNRLPAAELDPLHAGGDTGELDTDTMILIHIPDNGGPAVGISIPRDSWVNIPGYGMGKINSAYQDAKNTLAHKLEAGNGGQDTPAVERASDQAGAREAIAAVEALTGVTIDHFASINLYGFYQLSNAVGGVPVCLNHAVNDRQYSGAVFPQGVFTVQGVQALEFVRQRHNIPGGSTDLEREQRQQAFMASLAHKILSAGTLTDPGKLNRLISAVQQAVTIDRGWDLVSFAQQMSGMSSGNLRFETIPVVTISYPVDGTDAVEVDPAAVRAFVSGATGDLHPTGVPAPTPTGSAPTTGSTATTTHRAITVDVRNAAGVRNLAAAVLSVLTSDDFTPGDTGDAPLVSTSQIDYPTGDRAAAAAVDTALGGGFTLVASDTVPAGHVVVYLGEHYAGPGAGPNQAGASQAGAVTEQAATPGATSSAAPPTSPSPTISDAGNRPPCVN